MKNLFTWLGMIAITVLIGFLLTACPNVSTIDAPDLPGNISIDPAGDVQTASALTAVYSGAEEVAYQWNRGGSAVPGATGAVFIPLLSGSYSVTVSATGFNSKTSSAVTVTSSGTLAGTITITPASEVSAGMELTAVYTPAANESGITAYVYQWNRSGTIVGGNSATFTPYAGGNYTVTVGAAGYDGATSASVAVTGSTGAINDPILIIADSSINLDFNVNSGQGEKDLMALIKTRTAGTDGFISLDLTAVVGITTWEWDTFYNRNIGRFSTNELDKSKIVDIILPDIVTRIGDQMRTGAWREAFSGLDYTNLRTFLARNVTNVGTPNDDSRPNSAFQSTPAIFIDLPNATLIGDYCFYDYQSGLTINIPKVTSIGRQSFQHLRHDDPRDDLGSLEPITVIMGDIAPLLGPDMFKDNKGSMVTIKIPFGATGYTPIALFDGTPIAFGPNTTQPNPGSWVSRFRATVGGADVPSRTISFELAD